MQLRTVSALVIYLGSYLPLSVILLAQDIDTTVARRGLCPVGSMIAFECSSPFKNIAISIPAVVICAACLSFTVSAMRMLRMMQSVTVTESKHIPADLINYVLPYVLSFVSLDYGDPPKLIGFAVFFVWIFWITYKSGQIVLNPVLAVLGWRLFEVKYRHIGSEGILTGRILSAVDIEPGRTYRQGGLQDVMVVKDSPTENVR